MRTRKLVGAQRDIRDHSALSGRRAILRRRAGCLHRVDILGSPFRDGLVVDPAAREQPLAVHLHHLVLVVTEEVDRSAPVGTAGHVRPVRDAVRLVAFDLDHHVVDDVAADGRLLAGWSLRPRFLRALAPGRDELRDRLASLDLSTAVIEDALGRERARIPFGIAVVEGEHVARLQIFDAGTVIAIAGVGDAGYAHQGGCAELSESGAAHGRSPGWHFFIFLINLDLRWPPAPRPSLPALWPGRQSPRMPDLGYGRRGSLFAVTSRDPRTSPE